jgi:hypothetical protein
LTGSAKLVWNVDMNLVKSAIAGKNKADFSLLLKPFTGIQTSRAEVSPPWRKVFPEDVGKISIEVIEK